jgi:RimJ/RimL family protein N-acetyltransferase
MHILVRHGSRDLAGVAREGEPWADAARRIASTVHGDPCAKDLSGDPLVFEVDPDLVVTLRAAGQGDLPDLVRWRQSPAVLKWWAADGEPTEENVTAQYSPDMDGMTATRLWIAEVNGRSVGFVQDYKIKDYPEYALLAPDPDAIGVDYAIGEEVWLGRGLGTRILWAWMLRAHSRFPDATAYFAAPDHRNEPSLRVLDKLGFKRGLWFDEPQADGTVATVVGCTLDVTVLFGPGPSGTR